MNIPLKSLKYLAIDCQATGNSPKSSFPMEIGWLVFKADASPLATLNPRTLFLSPPERFDIPARITKLTGINARHLKGAVSGQSALEELCDQARRVARENQMTLCPTVIHYARYELIFLNEWQRRHNKSRPLPLDIFCTHQLAGKLMPELPRKGLRAVAGVLGHSVPRLKRCKAHLLATAHIWCKMLDMLAWRQDVHGLEQLRAWYKTSNVPAAPKRFPMPSEMRLGLPEGPGVYRMRRSNRDVLYIGKASSLKRRVNSYYQSSRHHSENILEMLTQAVDLEVVCTPTALEAALLETDAIKHIKPPYNIALTKEHRQLHYVSRNFDAHTPRMDKRCRLGPVPSLEPFIAAHLIGRCLRGQMQAPLEISKILAMPKAYCPDHECFQAGLTVFKENYSEAFRQKNIGQAVLHIGRRSWLEALKRKASPSDVSDDTVSNADTPEEFVWAPDKVARTLESVCRRCGFLVRRSRWFAILSESTVIWRHRNVDAERCNIIQLTAGVVTHRYDSKITQPSRAARYLKAPDMIRQAHLNIETYDRLRVLTTEIRRLMSENRLECILLRHNVSLSPTKLRVLLDWI